MVPNRVHTAPSAKASSAWWGLETVCPGDGVSLSHDREQHFDTCYAYMSLRAIMSDEEPGPENHKDVLIKVTCSHQASLQTELPMDVNGVAPAL